MFPLISTVAQASGVILDKIILTKRRVAFHVFVPLLFLFIFLVTAAFYPFLGIISPDFFELKNIALFMIMIIVAIIWNYFYYKGIESEKIQQFELILMFQPLLTIFLASVFLRGENNIHVEIAAFLAAIFLIFAQTKKHHLNLADGAVLMIFAVVFMSIELILIDLVLNFCSPIALYAIRTGIIFLVFYFIYRPKIFQVAKTNHLLILANAILGATQMVAKFYGFETYGVVYTSLILILAPLLIYLSSVYFFHEKLHLRTAICALAIFACIVYATVMGK
jgi:hypothetical protein